jgi:LysR family transcriptional activator of nhaA
MRAINHRHLFYFWRVASDGGVSAAARALHVSQSAISVQVQKLERALGHSLFERTGRQLSLTPEGRIVLDYAEEIFRLSTELRDTLAGRLEGRPMRLVVGLSGTIPNLVAFQLLEPAFALPDPVRTSIREKRPDHLLADLATHDVDMVLTDIPIPAHLNVRAFNHPLGASPVDIWAPPLLAHRLREGFPESLDGEPFILPAEGYTLRKSLEEWFDRVGIQPRVFAEIEDNDLINVFSEAGAGLFAAPAVIMADIRVRYAVEVVGRAEGVLERYYAITAHRKLKHPAVAAITRRARLQLSGWEADGRRSEG